MKGHSTLDALEALDKLEALRFRVLDDLDFIIIPFSSQVIKF